MAYLIPPSLLIPAFPWGLKLRLPYPSIGAGQGMFADGRPLIFGGQNVALSQTADQAFAPITNTLVFAADGASVIAGGALPSAFKGGKSTLLSDGRILAISTAQGENFVQTIDHVTLLWTARPTMIISLSNAGLVTLPSGNALRIGGDNSVGSPSQSVEEYNRLTNTWSSRAPLLNVHSPSDSIQATLLSNGDVLVTSDSNNPEVYTPGTNTWHQTTNRPHRGNVCQTHVNLPNGKLFTCTSTNGFILTPDIFDPITRIFTPIALHPAEQSEHSGASSFPNGFYIGEGLVLIMDTGLSPRTAIYDFRRNIWYGGGFDFDLHPLDFTETLGLTNLFYLGQYGFLTVGASGSSPAVPHRGGYYAQLSILPRTPAQIPTFAGVVSVTQGITDGSVFVEWATATDSVTVTDDFNYYVYVAQDPSAVNFTAGTDASNTEIWAGALSREITGLNPGSLYHFGVRARNLRCLNEPGNYDTNTVVFDFTTGSPGAPSFSWTATAPMHEARAGLMGATRADGRYHVFGGITSLGTVSAGGNIYAQNGLTTFPSDLGPGLAKGTSLNESPQNSSGHHRPTVVGGTANNSTTSPVVLKNYPYTDNWINLDGNIDANTSPQPMNVAVAGHTAVAMPFGDILKVGGSTSLGSPTTAVTTIERMSFRPREVDYTLQTTPFTVGDILTGQSSGAQSMIISDTGMIYTFLLISSNTNFIVGENVTGQTSGATGQVQIASSFNGLQRALYLDIGGTPFTEGEEILGDVSGDATISSSTLFQAAISTPLGTLTLDSLSENSFSGGEGLVGGMGGDGIVVNHPGPGVPQVDIIHGYQAWSTVSPLNRARVDHSSILLDDGRVFIIGGQNIYSLPERTAEIYDPATDTCTLITNVTPDVQALPYNINTVIGHFAVGETITGQISGATAVTVLDDGTGTITVNTVVGTFNPTEQILGSITGNVTLLGPLLHLTTSHIKCPSVKLLSAQILVIGGGDVFVHLFTPGADAITLAASLDSVKTEHTALRFGDGKVGVFGGRVSGVAVSDVRLYDPNLDSWSSPASMLTARCRHVSFLLPNNKALVVGGEDGTGTPTALAELSS